MRHDVAHGRGARGAAFVAVALVLAPPQARAAEPQQAALSGSSSARPMRFAVTLAGDTARLEACGGERALADGVRQRVRRDVIVPASEADIRFVVELEGGEPDAIARIVERDRGATELGRRELPLPSGDCAKTRETLAVVLGILVGPPREVVEPAPPPSPPPSPRAAPRRRALPRPPPVHRPTASDPLPPWAVTGATELAAGSGVLPDAAWAVQASLAVHLPATRLSAMLRVHYWPSQTGGAHPSSQVDRLGSSGSLCYALARPAPLGLTGCAGFDASRLRARSSDLTRGSETGWVLDVLGEARLGYRLARVGRFLFEPVLATQLAALVRRDRFLYRDYTGQPRVLLQPAPVAVQASLGLAVHFF